MSEPEAALPTPNAEERLFPPGWGCRPEEHLDWLQRYDDAKTATSGEHREG